MLKIKDVIINNDKEWNVVNCDFILGNYIFMLYDVLINICFDKFRSYFV